MYPMDILLEKLIVGHVLPIVWSVSQISNCSAWDTSGRMYEYRWVFKASTAVQMMERIHFGDSQVYGIYGLSTITLTSLS